jgi:hypothetical protein
LKTSSVTSFFLIWSIGCPDTVDIAVSENINFRITLLPN